ncbi:MAG: DUF2256 domain-containing protein [Pseudomonadota bacterium]
MRRPLKADLPRRTCVVCGRPFVWRKKWRVCWGQVRYCSKRCRREGRTSVFREPEANSPSR